MQIDGKQKQNHYIPHLQVFCIKGHKPKKMQLVSHGVIQCPQCNYTVGITELRKKPNSKL